MPEALDVAVLWVLPVVVAITAIGIGVLAYEARHVRVVREDVDVHRLAAALDGFRIVVHLRHPRRPVLRSRAHAHARASRRPARSRPADPRRRLRGRPAQRCGDLLSAQRGRRSKPQRARSRCSATTTCGRAPTRLGKGCAMPVSNCSRTGTSGSTWTERSWRSQASTTSTPASRPSRDAAEGIEPERLRHPRLPQPRRLPLDARGHREACGTSRSAATRTADS